MVKDINNYLSKPKKTKEFDTMMLKNPYECDTTHVIYLIRHGQAEHNAKKGIKKKFGSIMGKKDTELTDRGREQAFLSGQSLSIPSIDYLFSSDLKRTRQTLISFLKGNNK
jgi:broad specificity phosphatase PhoE